MIYRMMKKFVNVMLFIGTMGLCLTADGSQTEKRVTEWVDESILRISQKVREISKEYNDPHFVPRVLIGPVVTRTLLQREFYESQFSLLLRDAIYLKIAAGLAPIPMNVVDLDVLPKAMETSGLDSAARLNSGGIATVYTRDKALRQCVNSLLDVADMVVLGQITLKNTQALATFTIFWMKEGKLYLGHTPISLQTMPNISDITMSIEKDGIDKMLEFVVSTDDSIQRSVEEFVKRYADTWKKGDVSRMMSYYDKDASAVTLTVSKNYSVELTNILERDQLELVMVEFFERYRVTTFDYSKPKVYDVKRNSSNVVSCSVDFYADITVVSGEIRRLPLLSFYIQLRRESGKDWKIYFQHIKETPMYSMLLSEKRYN